MQAAIFFRKSVYEGHDGDRRRVLFTPTRVTERSAIDCDSTCEIDVESATCDGDEPPLHALAACLPPCMYDSV
jgi:hypothetical protein